MWSKRRRGRHSGSPQPWQRPSPLVSPSQPRAPGQAHFRALGAPGPPRAPWEARPWPDTQEKAAAHFFSRAWGGAGAASDALLAGRAGAPPRATEFTKSKACANQLTSFSARPWPGVWSADHAEQRTRAPSWGTHPTNFTSPYLHCTGQQRDMNSP